VDVIVDLMRDLCVSHRRRTDNEESGIENNKKKKTCAGDDDDESRVGMIVDLMRDLCAWNCSIDHEESSIGNIKRGKDMRTTTTHGLARPGIL